MSGLGSVLRQFRNLTTLLLGLAAAVDFIIGDLLEGADAPGAAYPVPGG